MTGFSNSHNQSAYCTTSAAAGTSLRLNRILDTVIIAVSILVVVLNRVSILL